jgi:biotin synthase
MIAAARRAAAGGACRLGIVTSGRAVRREAELEVLAAAVRRIAGELPIDPCASLGVVGSAELERLREAGLARYHHNLETAESFWPRVCSTRPWRESVRTVEGARRLGLPVCSGGIFGLGESLRQRVELLEAVAALDVDSVPLNFLHPIAGTPLEGLAELEPLDCVRIVAVARLMMPEREIRVCGGREHNLRDLQSWILLAGADGVMVGGYLTTSGREVADDVQMFVDAGLELVRP